MKQKKIVALVGRPNVGKSTLFNRLAGKRLAIVEDLAGTTRDRLYAPADWGGKDFILVDTGGLEMTIQPRQGRPGDTGQAVGVDSGLFLEEIRSQAQVGMEEADVIVLLVDAETGLTMDDQEVARLLYRTEKPVLLAVNKADNAERRATVHEFYALGLGDPYPVSALHGAGTGDLLDAVVERLEALEDKEGATAGPDEEDDRIHVAIVGRPNVGKSSILNRILGEKRSIVSDVPGTTRDSIDTFIKYDGLPITLVDTAGIRRRGRIEPGVEKYSVLRALKSMGRADVCLLVIDATQPVASQDAHIAGYILEEAKSVVVVVNKWDLVEKDNYTMQEYTEQILSALRFMSHVPLLFVSALTGQRVQHILPIALQVHSERLKRIQTSQLNKLLREAVAQHPPKHKGKKRLKFFYMTQAGVSPPTFVFFVNDRELVHFSYERYLENCLRREYGFMGTPLRMVFRNRKEES